MKKLRVAAVLLLTAFLAAGCGNREEASPSGQDGEENAASVENTDSQEEQQSTEAEDQTQSDTQLADENDENEDNNIESEEEQQSEQREVAIYYIDDSTAELTSETVAITDENDIWAALQEKGILTDECELLSFDVNEEEKEIDLDFNSALGDRVRSFGTTGETEIIGCLVNTYLDAYDCDGIKLTEEGQAFETSSGADFDGYTGRIEF